MTLRAIILEANKQFRHIFQGTSGPSRFTLTSRKPLRTDSPETWWDPVSHRVPTRHNWSVSYSKESEMSILGHPAVMGFTGLFVRFQFAVCRHLNCENFPLLCSTFQYFLMGMRIHPSFITPTWKSGPQKRESSFQSLFYRKAVTRQFPSCHISMVDGRDITICQYSIRSFVAESLRRQNE